MTQPLDLDALEALVRAATPGPWCEHPNGTSVWTGESFDSASTSAGDHLLNATAVDSHAVANVALVVELINAAPQLIAAARELEKVHAQLRFLYSKGCCVRLQDGRVATLNGLIGIDQTAKALGWKHAKDAG